MPEIIASPPCVTEVMAHAGCISEGHAYKILIGLAKAGFVVAPLEPTNSMFDAYMLALNMPAKTRKTIIANIGKARQRWKAMAKAGMKVAFSKQAKSR